MRNIRLLYIAAAVTLLSGCSKEMGSTVSTQPTPDNAMMAKMTGIMSGEYEEGCLMLFLDEATTKRIEDGDKETVMQELFSDKDIKGFEPAIRHTPKNLELARELGIHRWFTVTFDEDIPVQDFASEIAACPSICMMQFNNTPKLNFEGKASPFRAQTRTGEGENAIPFEDPMNSYQWNLVNTGDKNVSSAVLEGADVGVKDAWKLTGGTPDVIVAICDAPVKYTHPDLAGAMWTNEVEQNGEKGVDDDGNGYIDDIHGYNFSGSRTSHGSIYWEDKDESGHGTHVAGIVGAVNGNGIGVSSVAGGTGNGDGVRLMSCQMFEGNKTGGDSGMAAALMYAADMGACIAQCSYGYSAYLFSCDNDYIANAPLEYRALKYFTNPSNSNHPALTSNIAIYAAGNETAPNSDYPGALPLCVSVTAFGPDFLPAGYTNYGKGCNIAAPGGDYWVGVNDLETNRSRILSTCISEVSGDYAWMEGSSMACPHVSGVAALGISYAGKLGKKFSGEEFTALLLTSVNDMNQYLTSGLKPFGDTSIHLKTYKDKMGTGAIDAWKLLMQIEGTPSVMIKTGSTSNIDLKEYFGESAGSLTYQDITYDDEVKKTLGFAAEPRIKDGMLAITCTKNGAAKITVSAIAGGKEPSNGNNIGGTVISREISIVSRGVCSSNGGWL